VPLGGLAQLASLRPRQAAIHAIEHEREREEPEEHAGTIPGTAFREPSPKLDSDPSEEVMSDLEDPAVETESLFAAAIREHLDLKERNSELAGEMPLESYLNGDPLENHPLFKSEEQARIEETMDGEPVPAERMSSERLPWPGEETVESVEGAALDETLWTGRPRDFDWGD
jgi:hypothetical protein